MPTESIFVNIVQTIMVFVMQKFLKKLMREHRKALHF